MHKNVVYTAPQSQESTPRTKNYQTPTKLSPRRRAQNKVAKTSPDLLFALPNPANGWSANRLATDNKDVHLLPTRPEDTVVGFAETTSTSNAIASAAGTPPIQSWTEWCKWDPFLGLSPEIQSIPPNLLTPNNDTIMDDEGGHLKRLHSSSSSSNSVDV